MKHRLVTEVRRWPYSNYLEWIGIRAGTLVDRAFIQAHFEDTGTYEQLVRDYLADAVELARGVKEYVFEE